eukprot:s699_g2.t3
MCSSSQTIDSILSSTAIYAPGQHFVYKLVDENGAAVEMIFEALHAHPWVKATTTLHQGFGMLTNQATATRLGVSFRDAENQEPVKLPYFALSFVQLVETSFHSHKNIKIVGNWTDAVVAQGTTVLVHHQDDKNGNWISFQASKTDVHQEAPSSPSLLTVDQFKEAATLRFVELESFQIHIDVGVHELHGFLFSTTAAVLCADVPNADNPPVKFVTNPRVFELTVQETENTHIVRATNSSLFQLWYVREGDNVHVGDALFQVTSMEGLQDVKSNVTGTVKHLQALLPGDFVEAGAPIMVIDISGTDWVFIASVSVAVIAVIGVIICIWRCCCNKSAPEPEPDPDDPEKPEPIPYTILEFETPSGWKQIAEWKHQPLGLGFYEETTPPQVAYVGKDAIHLGVKKGDYLVAVGDPHLVDCCEFVPLQSIVPAGGFQVVPLRGLGGWGVVLIAQHNTATMDSLQDQNTGMIKTEGKAFDSVWRELKTRADRLPLVPRLLLRFEKAGRYQDFEWRTKPLGLVFSDSLPITVTDVHEEAEHLGVRVGDVLTGYGAESHLLKSVEGKSADEVWKAITHRMADFPVAPSLVMVFELPDKSTKEFYWRARPLGIEIGTSLPIAVEKVTSERSKSSTPPRRPARTATEASSPSKWGEVVSSLPVVRLSEHSSVAGSPRRGKDLGLSPPVAAINEPVAVPSTPAPTLWSSEPKLRPKASPVQQAPASSGFWKTHEQYALQRSRESGIKAYPTSLFEPQQRIERPELAGRSALEGRQHDPAEQRSQQEPSALLSSYLPTAKTSEFSPAAPKAAAGVGQPAPSPLLPAKEPAPLKEDAYQFLLQQLTQRLAESGPPLDYLAGQSSALANQQLAYVAWHQAAASAALQGPTQDPWRPTPKAETAFCLTEMVEFLQRRLEVQSKQIRHLKAELAARSRLAKSFQE